ncbi:MAG TPA: hypothetical protein VI386_38080 [Candidatus Sulfotelmatobacter sp.]
MKWKRAIRLGILAFATSALAVYVGDFAIFRAGLAMNRSSYRSVSVQHSYAVRKKTGKTEYLFDPPQPETCVRSLFAHQGYLPCWYLTRHTQPQTEI